MKETMTIHKALCELKVLDSRIESAMDKCEFAVANKHSNEKIHGVPVADYINEMRNNYQSVRTLINRRNAIKRAVTRSNATTMVKVGDMELTVAEAIDMKAKGVEYLQSLVQRIDNQYAHAKRLADNANGEALDSRADEYVRGIYGNTDGKNMSDEIKKVRDVFVAAHTVEIIDPIGCVEESSALNQIIDSFLSDVDSALSVSNALTAVEVEYVTK